jgi:hypothetical protein
VKLICHLLKLRLALMIYLYIINLLQQSPAIVVTEPVLEVFSAQTVIILGHITERVRIRHGVHYVPDASSCRRLIVIVVLFISLSRAHSGRCCSDMGEV